MTFFSGEGALKVGSHSPPPRPRPRPRPGAFESANAAPAPADPAAEPGDKPYLARLVLLVPAEVISLYVAMKPLAANFIDSFGLVCLFLVLLVRMKATTDKGKPEWISVLISVISFGLWVYAVGGQLPLLPDNIDPNVMAVSIAVWTFAVPYFYRGQAPAPAPKPDPDPDPQPPPNPPPAPPQAPVG